VIAAVFIILSVFFGLSMVVGTAAGAILIANGKLTLPNTNYRRVQRERAQLTLDQIRLERESMQLRLDDAIQLRLERATDSSSREPLSTDFVTKEAFSHGS